MFQNALSPGFAAVVAEDEDPVADVIAVSDSIPLTRGEGLRPVEAEDAHVTEAAGLAPVVFGPDCLGRVLDDRDAVAAADLQDGVHVRHPPVEVDGDDGLGPRRQRSNDSAERHQLLSSTSANTGGRPHVADGCCGGNPGDLGHDDFVTGPDPEARSERWRAEVQDGSAMACATPTCFANASSKRWWYVFAFRYQPCRGCISAAFTFFSVILRGAESRWRALLGPRRSHAPCTSLRITPPSLDTLAANMKRASGHFLR